MEIDDRVDVITKKNKVSYSKSNKSEKKLKKWRIVFIINHK